VDIYRVTITVDPLTLNTYISGKSLTRLWHDQTVPNFSKSNNPRLSYSDIRIENLGTVPHHGFHGMWISLRCLYRPITHPHTKFQQNPTIRSRYILGGGGLQRDCFSEVSGPDYIKFGRDISKRSPDERLIYWWFNRFLRSGFYGAIFKPIYL